jgi:PhzF family phenazine biosynthesis protein
MSQTASQILPFYQIDAFTSQRLAGNAAAVMPLEDWLPDRQLQAIAAEHQLSETAFFVPQAEQYELRWFTPAAEVELCGHGTLAAAYVILNDLRPALTTVHFTTRYAGPLSVERKQQGYQMRFPREELAPLSHYPELADALGVIPEAMYRANDKAIAVLRTAQQVRDFVPAWAALEQLPEFGVAITAEGDEPGVDFVSRFFAPQKGIREDPVTGALHCALGPLWSMHLGFDRLHARQVGPRGGQLTVEVHDAGVLLTGDAVKTIAGSFFL